MWTSTRSRARWACRPGTSTCVSWSAPQPARTRCAARSPWTCGGGRWTRPPSTRTAGRVSRRCWRPPASALLRLQHEHGDLAVGLRLVLGVGGEGRDGALPPLRPLVAVHLAGDVVLRHGPVLQRELGVRLDVVVPGGVLRGAALGGDDGVPALVLHPHDRGVAEQAALRAT